MKMITAIVNKKDTGEVCSSLVDAGFYFTKTASSGGFLTAGNTTLVIGVEDECVEAVIDIIRAHCSRRVESIPGMIHSGVSTHVFPTEVVVGGATVFVTPVERFEKI